MENPLAYFDKGEKNDWHERFGIDTEAEQISRAIAINRGGKGAKGIIVESRLKDIMSKVESSEGESARSFIYRRFYDEWTLAQELGTPEEQLGDEAGKWFYNFPIKPLSEGSAVFHTWSALLTAVDTNDAGLRRIYDLSHLSETRDGENFTTRLAFEPFKKSWLKFTTECRDPLTNEGFRDWMVGFNPVTGEYENKKDTNVAKLFDVSVVSIEELDQIRIDDRSAKEMKVARVLLIKNDEGLIDEVEVMIPHATNEEETARKILRPLVEEMPIDDRDINGRVRVNRYYKRVDLGDGEEMDIFDLDTDFRLSKFEEDLYKRSLGKFYGKMPISIILPQVYMGLYGGESGVICVGPNKKRRDEKILPSGLQFALLPKIYKFGELSTLVDAVSMNKTNIDRVQVFIDKFKDKLSDLNEFMKVEFERARKALGTIALLDTYLPPSQRKLFETLFKDEDRLVSRPTVQSSSVNYIDDGKTKPNLDKLIFRSGLNVTVDTAFSIASFEGSKTIGVRMRTTREIHDTVKGMLDRMGRSHTQENMLMGTKLLVKERVKKFRFAMILFSAGILGMNNDEISKTVDQAKEILV